MKTLIVALTMVLASSISCFAQTEKGTWLVGGGASSSFRNGTYISIYPNLGYFVVDNLAVGASLPFSYSKNERVATKGGGIGPFARYYFGKSSATRVFAEAGGAIQTGRVESNFPDYQEVNFDYFRSSIKGGVGLVHFVTPQIGLEARFKFENYGDTFNNFTNPRRNRLSFGIGLQGHLFKAKD